MNREGTKLKLIGLIIEMEDQLNDGKKDEFWYGDKFDALLEENLLGLEIKYNLLVKKIKERK